MCKELQTIYNEMFELAQASPTMRFMCYDHNSGFGWVAFEDGDEQASALWRVSMQVVYNNAKPEGALYDLIRPLYREQGLRELVERARGICIPCQQPLETCECHPRGHTR